MDAGEVICFTKSAGRAGYAGMLSLVRERGPGRVPDPPVRNERDRPSWNLILSVLDTTTF
jgi:hypothetical protein